MKKILFLAIVSSLSWKLCGQSIEVSDSTLTANEFIGNSKRILDSLTRFHFVKQELAQERKDKNEWKSNYFTLNTQTIGCKNDLITEKKIVISVQTRLDEKARKYKNANTERWIFRGSTLVGIAIFILKTLKP